MKKLIKILAVVVGVVVILITGAIVFVSMTFDPNDYKAEIVDAVKENTGRDLRIEGDIELTVFPWLGVTAGTIELGNAPGFAGDVFARTEKVDVRVKLMPLLSKQVEMSTVTVHGLALNLAKDKNGKTNWEDLAEGGNKPEAEKGEGPGIAALAIGGLDIQDANLSWTDAQAGQTFKISALNAKTGSLSLGKPVDLSVDFDLEGAPPKIAGHVALSATLEVDPDAGAFNAKGLKLEANLSGPDLPGGKAAFSFAADVAANMKNQTAKIDNLELSVLDLNATGNLAVSDLQTAPKVNGSLNVSEFNPKALLEQLGQAPIETTDPKALTAVSLSATMSGTPGGTSLDPIKIKLDDTTLEGKLSVGPPAIRFDLGVDAIDADRYLPPKSEAQAASPGAAATGAADLPVEVLRALDIDGKFRVGTLKVANLNVSDISLTLKAKDGLINLSPIAAKLYDGTYAGNIGLDARGEQPKFSLDEKLSNIQAEPLLKDLQGKETLSGIGNIEAKLSAVGANPEAMKKTLNGNAAFAFTDGAIKGIDIGGMIREATAKLSGGSAPSGDAAPKTDFTELTGTVQIKNGLATNNDLSAKSPLLRIEGKGSADIPKESIDYRVTTTVVATAQGQGGGELTDMVGVPIPIKVTGTFQEPKYGLDMQALASAIAKSKATGLLKGSTEGLLGGGTGEGAAAGAAKKATEAVEGIGKTFKGLFD